MGVVSAEKLNHVTQTLTLNGLSPAGARPLLEAFGVHELTQPGLRLLDAWHLETVQTAPNPAGGGAVAMSAQGVFLSGGVITRVSLFAPGRFKTFTLPLSRVGQVEYEQSPEGGTLTLLADTSIHSTTGRWMEPTEDVEAVPGALLAYVIEEARSSGTFTYTSLGCPSGIHTLGRFRGALNIALHRGSAGLGGR